MRQVYPLVGVETEGALQLLHRLLQDIAATIQATKAMKEQTKGWLVVFAITGIACLGLGLWVKIMLGL